MSKTHHVRLKVEIVLKGKRRFRMSICWKIENGLRPTKQGFIRDGQLSLLSCLS